MPKKKVLVIEDHRDTLAIYLIVLEHHGFEVRLAWTGEDGVKQFTEWQPDIIVLDMMLPEISGVEVLQRIRAMGSEVPVVAATANIKPIVRDLCRELGVKTFLSKPFDFEQLVVAIRQELALPDEPAAPATEQA